MVVYTPRDEVDSTGEENPHQEIEMGFAYSEGNPVEDQSRLHKPPFDTERLDRLMEEAGLDALLVTSKHSIQYLLGNYRFFFYDYMDAHGLSRYFATFCLQEGTSSRFGLCRGPMGAL